MKSFFNLTIPAISLLFVVALLLVTGCKKDHSTQPAMAVTNSLPYRITHIETYGNATLNFTYNPDSTVKAINSAGYQYEPSLAFSYQPGEVLIKRTVAGDPGLFELDSVSLNNAGRIINVRRFGNPERTSWKNDRYTLNANSEVMQIEAGVSSSSKTAKFNFTYVNGNLTHDATAALYLYDLTKPAQFGDRNSLENFLNYGVKYPLSKNLVIGAVYGKDTTFYKYYYDKAGRIINYRQEQRGATLSQYVIAYQ